METARPLPAPTTERAHELNPPAATKTVIELGLIPLPLQPEPYHFMAMTAPVAHLPVELEVSLPARDFRVRNLLALEPGQVIETHWAHDEDMPLAAGDVQLAWSEFEVVDSQLAMRITRLV